MTQFADQLVRPTVVSAAKIDFYRRFWSDVDLLNIQTTSDLCRLPVLTKSDALKFLNDFEYETCPAILSHSSGTTTGSITIRCRSPQELEALWEVHRDLMPIEEDGTTPLVLSVDCANHGQHIPLPAAKFGLKAVGFDWEVIHHIRPSARFRKPLL